MIALKGLSPSRGTFRQGVCFQSKLPKLDQLKVDYIPKECMLISQGIGDSSIGGDIQILTTQVHKRKKPKFKGKRKHMDYSKMQCFRCNNYGHSAIQCPNRLKHQASFAKVSKSDIDLERCLF